MGIFFRNSSNVINNRRDEERINLNQINNIIEIKNPNAIEEKPSIMKIYLIGDGKGKNSLINEAFKDFIKDPILQKKADKEFKTDQFHWILSIYSSNFLSKEICEKVSENIKKERNEIIDENNKNILNQPIIICFGECKYLGEFFEEMRKPKIILVTEKKYELKIDKRFVINIISRDLKDNQICSQIISSLWEIDCYFNERDNRICRYSPENIFKDLEKDNSLFSINILLTGFARVGKSSFINILAGKMLALELDKTDSVTRKITEYYIYKNDEKDEHGAIKLIDTPGIVPHDKDEVNQEYLNEEKKIFNMIKNNENETNLSKKIHFIFVILKNDGVNVEGENINEFYKILNESKCPVFFIINNVEENYDKDDIVCSLSEGLNADNILKEENFINANFKVGDVDKIHGINKIFEKVSNYITDENILDKTLKKKMDELLKDFRTIEKNEFSLFFDELNEDEEKAKILEAKNKINFKDRIDEINKLWESNEFFKKISIESILENGRLFAKSCNNVLITLSNLKGILPTISKDIPLISVLQAFMVKEIETGYGLNINSLNYGLKILKNKFLNILLNNNNELENRGINANNKREVLNEQKISENLDSISKRISDLLEKSNKKLVFQVAALLMKLAETAKYNQLEDSKIFNVEFTNIIEQFCCKFCEKEIIFSERLTFMYNYYDKLCSLFRDIKYYANKEEWDTFEMEIRK